MTRRIGSFALLAMLLMVFFAPPDGAALEAESFSSVEDVQKALEGQFALSLNGVQLKPAETPTIEVSRQIDVRIIAVSGKKLKELLPRGARIREKLLCVYTDKDELLSFSVLPGPRLAETGNIKTDVRNCRLGAYLFFTSGTNVGYIEIPPATVKLKHLVSQSDLPDAKPQRACMVPEVADTAQQRELRSKLLWQLQDVLKFTADGRETVGRSPNWYYLETEPLPHRDPPRLDIALELDESADWYAKHKFKLEKTVLVLPGAKSKPVVLDGKTATAEIPTFPWDRFHMDVFTFFSYEEPVDMNFPYGETQRRILVLRHKEQIIIRAKP